MKIFYVLFCAAASFAQLQVDSVMVDSVWNSDSASRVSRDCRVSFIPQGTGQVYAFLSVSSDGGASFWSSRDSAFVLEEALLAILPCGVKKTVTVRVLGGDRDDFVVRIRIRQSNQENWPAWRKAMTQPNKIYDISDNTLGSIVFTFPGGTIPSQFSNSDGAAGTGATIYGYGGGQLFNGVGNYGVLVFGSGGENFAGNMTGGLDLGADAAHFSAWNQPAYSLSAADSSEFYWSPTDAAALPANRKFTNFNFDTTTWDRVFPVAINSWVYARPMKYVEPMPGVPLGQFRYDQHCFIPAEYTGLNAGVWFIPSAFFMTPGFYYGSSNALMTDFWPSGGKKWYSHYQREDTKEWNHLEEPIPEGMGTGGFGGQIVGFCAKYKKMVSPFMGPNGRSGGVFDVSNGVANGTWSLVASPIRGISFEAAGLRAIRLSTRSAMSTGHPRNRAFYAWHCGNYATVPEGLGILDFDDPAYPIYHVTLPELTGTTDEMMGLHYLPGLNKFVSFGIGGDSYNRTIYCQTITVPDDLSDTAAYVVTDVPLSTALGVDLSSSIAWGGQVQYVESLNCIVFMAVNKPAKAFWVE